jgi:hypothetical protein
MQKKYRYRLDRRGRRITAVVTTLLVTAFVAFHFVWGANYLPAWMLFLLLCVVLLYILSIPRYVSLDDTSIDIHCIVDLTRIHLEDVELIRRIEPDEFRRLWPLLGSYGFWGYFGYYFSFREWNLYKVYASERKNLVLIEDIYEDTFIISCEQADELITLVIEARDRKRAEILKMFIFALSTSALRSTPAFRGSRPEESLLRRTGIPGFKILNPVISCSLTSN